MATSIKRRALVAGGMGLILAGTLAGAPQPAWAQKKELTPVTVRLAFNYNGHRSPYLLGVDKGFYAEEGLDVEGARGQGRRRRRCSSWRASRTPSPSWIRRR